MHQSDKDRSMIVPGTPEMAKRDSGVWVFVDIGFSKNSKSCCIAIDESEPCNVHYGDLGPRIACELNKGPPSLNLLIEAPLSVAFNEKGNPTGRRIEKRSRYTRHWYVGAGATTLLATTYLLRQLQEMHPAREIRLFEGFVSFKPKTATFSHAADVLDLRSVVWGKSENGEIVGCDGLKMGKGDILRSAFAVSGMDFGIPTVVVVDRAV